MAWVLPLIRLTVMKIAVIDIRFMRFRIIFKFTFRLTSDYFHIAKCVNCNSVAYVSITERPSIDVVLQKTIIFVENHQVTLVNEVLLMFRIFFLSFELVIWKKRIVWRNYRSEEKKYYSFCFLHRIFALLCETLFIDLNWTYVHSIARYRRYTRTYLWTKISMHFQGFRYWNFHTFTFT